MRPLSYAQAHVILIAFTLDTPDSLDNAQYKWSEEVRRICGPNVPVLLVGCKSDLRAANQKDDRRIISTAQVSHGGLHRSKLSADSRRCLCRVKRLPLPSVHEPTLSVLRYAMTASTPSSKRQRGQQCLFDHLTLSRRAVQKQISRRTAKGANEIKHKTSNRTVDVSYCNIYLNCVGRDYILQPRQYIAMRLKSTDASN